MTSATSSTLLLRADAGPSIGAGHVLRCLALAQGYLARGGQVRLRTLLAADSPLARRFVDAGAEVETLAEDPGSLADRQATLECLHRLGSRHVVVDGYHFDGSFQAGLCDADCNVLWIDDEAHAPPYRARWILNQNLHADADLYGQRRDDCRLLLGPRYALVRQEFLGWRDRLRTTPSAARRVLVTLGGGDRLNATGKVVEGLQLLLREGRCLEVDVVVGGLSPHLDALRSQVAPEGDAVRILHDVEDMAPLMARADLAITAAGSTTWELALMGLPALVGILADNQVPGAEVLDARGSVRLLGWFRETSAERIADAVADLMHDASQRVAASRAGRRMVDGRGVERVLDHLFGARESSLNNDRPSEEVLTR